PDPEWPEESGEADRLEPLASPVIPARLLERIAPQILNEGPRGDPRGAPLLEYVADVGQKPNLGALVIDRLHREHQRRAGRSLGPAVARQVRDCRQGFPVVGCAI